MKELSLLRAHLFFIKLENLFSKRSFTILVTANKKLKTSKNFCVLPSCIFLIIQFSQTYFSKCYKMTHFSSYQCSGRVQNLRWILWWSSQIWKWVVIRSSKLCRWIKTFNFSVSNCIFTNLCIAILQYHLMVSCIELGLFIFQWSAQDWFLIIQIAWNYTKF